MENKALVEEETKKSNIDNYVIDIHFQRKDEGNILTWKRGVAFLIGSAGLIIVSFIVGLFAVSFTKDLDTANAITTFGTYGTLFVAFIIFFLPEFKTLFKQFLDIELIARGLLMGLLVMLIPSLYFCFVNLSDGYTVNNNETTIRTIVNLFPACTLLFAGVLGPVCEEFTYRVGLYGLLKKKNKILAYIITSLVFAFIHFDFTSFVSPSALAIELVNLPAYLLSGIILTYTFDRYGFAAGCIAHMLNNIVSLLGSIGA